MSETEYAAPERALASAHREIARWSLDRIYLDPSAAAAAIEASFHLPEIAEHRPSFAGAHFALGAARAVLGELDLAEEHLNTAEAIYSEIGDELAIAHVTVRRDLIWHQREEFHRPFEVFPAAIEIARKHGDGWLEAALLSDLGMIHLRTGNIPDGVDSLFAALESAERGNDLMQETVIRMNLAGSFIELHDFETATTWLRQCLTAAHSLGTLPIVFECTQALAICAGELGDPEQALELLQEAIDLAERLEYPFGLAESSYDQGRFLVHLKQPEQAARAFNRAISLLRHVDTPTASARIAMCEWWLESLSGEFTEQTYRRLNDIAEKSIVAPYQRAFDLHDALSKSAEALRMESAALAHLRESRKLAEEYWEAIAERQARVALKRHQVATAERAAEQERRHREELAKALHAAEKLNAENQELLEKLRAQSVILEQQATEDSLTGIGNRRYFDVQLERELSRAQQFNRPISVALADIDNFKEINDRHSHRVGDEVLITVAAIIRKILAGTEVYARYGGEEFAFIFPEAESEEAWVLAEGIRRSIQQYDWESVISGLAVTLSIGLVTRTGAVTPGQIVSAADSLLYLAKRTGKNQVEHREINDESIDDHSLFAHNRSHSWVIT